MTDERALFAAICEHPEEDTPRLMYADWLEEHGDEDTLAQAEFIRTQIERYHLSPEDDDRKGVERRFNLQRRELELRVQQDRKAYRPWGNPNVRHPPDTPEGVNFLWFHQDCFVRGFRGFAVSTPERFAAVGSSLFNIYPVHELFAKAHGLALSESVLTELLSASWLTRIRRMEMDLRHLFAERIFGCEHLVNLEKLTIDCGALAPPGSPTVGTRAALTRLRSLTFNSSDTVPALMPRLLELLPGDGLTELKLDWRDTAGALRELALSKRFPNLTRLWVTKQANAPVLAPALQAVVQAPFWKRLRTLGLHAGVGDAEAAILATAPKAPIRDLSLAFSSLTPAGLKSLAASPLLHSVTKLSLQCGRFGDDGLVALAKSPNLVNLSVLDVHVCDMGPKGVQALVAAPWSAGLIRLNLQNNKIMKAGAEALIAGRFPRLRELKLHDCVRTNELKDKLTRRFGAVVDFN
jgi:uncharacterized protein (TIGR02996 family)